MKFRFEDQPHQAAAAAAVVDLFEDALRAPLPARVGQAPGADGHEDYRLDLSALQENLATVSAREDVANQSELVLLEGTDLQDVERSFPNFSVEMETGTGKTYVYISTALQLAEQYGLRKFVILVHSVAIRAGVVKTFEQTREHFELKYPGIKYRWGVLGESGALADFAEPGDTVRFLITSVQSLDKPETNSLYSSKEEPQLWDFPQSGVAQISSKRPVLIIDEPQNMATELRRRAIATLNPLVALRYSATHREAFNLVHRLGPKQAAEAGLVKRVSVKGIIAGQVGQPYLRFDRLRSVRRRLMAEVTIDRRTGEVTRRDDVILQNGSDLFEESDGLEAYRGLVVDRFERGPDRIIFENGLTVGVGEEIGVDQVAVWRDQIRHTIRQHFDRQRRLDAAGHDVKVLSLFFVERVADYVGADGASADLPEMFDAIFREEWARAGFPVEEAPDPAEVRVGYFPSTKTGILKDTNNRASDAELEARAYQEIIANKELILDRSNPRAFIFSHSALREGWDNPNVFQVGFLRHTRSDLERRQQIGRGLRLPVNQTGRRVHDPSVNRLTLIVDETFAEFRSGLNAEYDRSGTGAADRPQVDDVDTEVIIRRRQDLFEGAEFAELWNRIRYRARYRVSLVADAIKTRIASSERLDELSYLERRANVVEDADLIYDAEGRLITADSAVSQSQGERLEITGQRLPDVIRLIEDQLLVGKFPLQLTRRTIAGIVADIPARYKRNVLDDPDRWARIVAGVIRREVIEEMVDGITYEAVEAEQWWDANVVFLPDEIKSPAPVLAGNPDPQSGVAPAPEGGANLYDHVDYDSHVERNFAAQLESNRDHVRLFTKLPRRFKVATPVGEYSPDWAIVYDDNGQPRLYLVRETKNTLNLDDLEWGEAMRIRFAGRHFAAAPNGDVDYGRTTDHDGLRIEVGGSNGGVA